MINFLTGKWVYINKRLRSEVEICAISANKLKKKVWQNSDQVKVLWTRQTMLTSITLTDNIISEEYRDFTELFVNEALGKTLFKHQSWDHEILIQEEKTLRKTSIYSLSSEKLEMLWIYLDENLKKDFIQKL